MGSTSRSTLPNSSSNMYLRIRPHSPEMNAEQYTVLSATSLLVKRNDNSSKKFTFTRIFDADASQIDIFDHSVRQRVLDFLLGESSTILAYGVSNSGKTHTLYGNPESPGVIPRSLEFVFSTVNSTLTPWYKVTDDNQIVALNEHERAEEVRNKACILNPGVVRKDEYLQARLSLENSCPQTLEPDDRETCCDVALASVWLSVAEIYNDNVYDLLAIQDEERRPLRMATRKDGTTYAKGVKFVHVTTALEACQLLISAQSRMTMASTALNVNSSRSHTFFTIRLLSCQKQDAVDEVQVSTLTFCDVAGSGRFKRRKEEGVRLAESRSIKNSLLVLGRCLKSARDSYSNGEQISGPFRESKLTRMLQRVLTGREKVAFIVTVCSGGDLLSEIPGVLNVSAITRRVEFRPKKLQRGVVEASPRSPSASMATSVVQTIAVDLEEYQSLKFQNEKLVKELEAQKNATLVCEGQTMSLIGDDSFFNFKDLGERNGRLMQTIETLERYRLKRELEIRQDLANQYMSLIDELEVSWKRAQEIEDEGRDLLKWSVGQAETFYKERIDSIMCRKKRKRSDGGDYADEARSIYYNLETENSLVTSKVVVLREMVRRLKTENELLSTDRNKCRFELALAKEELKDFRNTIKTHFPELFLNVQDERNGPIQLVEQLKRMFDGKIGNIETLEKDLNDSREDYVRVSDNLTKIESELQEMRTTQEETMIRARDLERELLEKTSVTHDLQLQVQLLVRELSETRESEVSGKTDSPRSIRQDTSARSNDFCSDEIGIAEPITQVREDTKTERCFTFDDKEPSIKLPLNVSDVEANNCFENMESLDRSALTSSDGSMKEDSGIGSSCRTSRRLVSVNDSLVIRETNEKGTQTSVSVEHNDVTIYERMERLKFDHTTLKEQHTHETRCVAELSRQVDDLKGGSHALERIAEAEECKDSLMPREDEMDGSAENSGEPMKMKGASSENYEERIDKLVEGSASQEENRCSCCVRQASEDSVYFEKQSPVLRDMNLKAPSIECKVELVSKIQRLEDELLVKNLELNEMDGRLGKARNDLLRVHQLHEKVNKLETVLEKCQEERSDYYERLQEHLRAQSMLETKVERLSAEIGNRERELTSLETEIGGVTAANAVNSETVKSLSKEIVESNRIMRNINDTLACSEEIRRHLEKSSKEEISILQSRIAAFASFLNETREENEDKQEEIDRLKLQLLDKVREIGLFKRHRDTMIRKYERLVTQLRIEIDKRKEQLAKFEKFFLLSGSNRRMGVPYRKRGKFKVARSTACVWTSGVCRNVNEKAPLPIPEYPVARQRSDTQSPDKNPVLDSGVCKTEESCSTESSSRLNDPSLEAPQTLSDVSDGSEVRCGCGVGFRETRKQGRMTGWMKVRRIDARTELLY